MAAIPAQVLPFITRHGLLQAGDRILVGVSGGPDSVALLHVLGRLTPRYRLSLGAAYFDHGLRPEAAPAEAELVAAQATAVGARFYRGQGEAARRARELKVSVQMAARDLRRGWLEELRHREGYAKLALGHTADDQTELFFLRLLRGAGPEGLGGMPPATAAAVIRPLLALTKAEVTAWLEQEGIPCCQDASNRSRKYGRNRIRLDLLPELARTYNPNLAGTVARTQALLREQDDYCRQEALRWLKTWGLTAGGPWRLKTEGLAGVHPAVARRALREALLRADAALAGLNFPQLEQALHLALRPQTSGTAALPGGWRLVRDGGWLELTAEAAPQEPPPGEYVFPPGEAGECTALGWQFRWRRLPREAAPEAAAQPQPGTGPGTMTTVALDYERVRLPLAVRTWRGGDRFRPAGMAGSKKLQDVFVDAKVPRRERSGIPLVLSGGEIAWVVGMRVAEPVRVRPETREVLLITAWRQAGDEG